MEHKVSIAAGKEGLYIKIDEFAYDRYPAIPIRILNELTEDQKQTIHQFFGINEDPRGDKKRVFGHLKQ